VKIAILGAECTGKTTLAHALATALDGCGGRAAWVSETLRDWCRQNGRTPEAHEQRAIALAQAARIDTAAAVAWLLVDTMNQCFREPVVDTATGGKGGGGARITPFGKKVLRRYRLIEAKAAAAISGDIRIFARDFLRKR